MTSIHQTQFQVPTTDKESDAVVEFSHIYNITRAISTQSHIKSMLGPPETSPRQSKIDIITLRMSRHKTTRTSQNLRPRNDLWRRERLLSFHSDHRSDTDKPIPQAMEDEVTSNTGWDVPTKGRLSKIHPTMDYT